jgi:branched-chain amino acid transport system ATP-binding protein
MSAALEVERVSKRFGAQEVVSGVSLALVPGERHAVIGPNGAGKSTLFHLISGRLPLSGGRVVLQGRDVTGAPPQRIARLGLSRSFQITNVFPRLSTFENLRCAALWDAGDRYCFWRPVTASRAANARAHAMLQQLDLASRAEVPAGLLSYAEQRALEIGMAVMGDPAVVLLDEPTAGMSHAETERAVTLIRQVSAGRTLLMVEHDMSVVFGLADRITVMVGGKLLRTGTPAEVRDDPAVREAYLGDFADAPC